MYICSLRQSISESDGSPDMYIGFCLHIEPSLHAVHALINSCHSASFPYLFIYFLLHADHMMSLIVRQSALKKFVVVAFLFYAFHCANHSCTSLKQMHFARLGQTLFEIFLFYFHGLFFLFFQNTFKP